MAVWENLLKIQHDELVIQYSLGIIAPDASISVQNAPKSLHGGWGSAQTPLPAG